MYDGIRIHMYYFNERWEISSKYETDSPSYLVSYQKYGVNGNSIFTLENLFWKIWKNLNYKFPEEKNVCFTFYFQTGKHRHVIDIREDIIILVDCYEIPSLKQLQFYHFAKKI